MKEIYSNLGFAEIFIFKKLKIVAPQVFCLYLNTAGEGFVHK